MLDFGSELWVRTPTAMQFLRCGSRNTVPRRAARLGVRSMSIPGTTTPVYALKDLERARQQAEKSARAARVKRPAGPKRREPSPAA